MNGSHAHEAPQTPQRRRRQRRTAVVALASAACLVAVGVIVYRSVAAAPRSGASATVSISSSPSTATTTPTTRTSSAPAAPALTAATLDRYLHTRAGDVTAAVLDLRTGRLWQWRPGVAEDTASIVKVDILATLLHHLQASGGHLTSAQVYLAETMIEDSDNDSASDLWDEVGENSGVASFDALIGLTGTTPGADGYWGLTTTTADDQIRLLHSLVTPNVTLSAASRSYELGLMEHVEASEDWGVSSGPTGATVALKNGWLPQDNGWQINSIGWVDGSGRDYLIAVLTAQNSSEGYGIATIEGLSQRVWEELGS